jgi:hypothetical protein
MTVDHDTLTVAVEDLTDEGSEAFRASAIARRVGAEIENVRQQLMQLVGEGTLRLRFDVVCPDNGRTIKSFNEETALPIGQELSSDRCESGEPFVVEPQHIWVQFVPTEAFRTRVRRERARRSPPARRDKQDDDPPGLRRWINWRRTSKRGWS